jgi:SAM-dependent methyltransferase
MDAAVITDPASGDVVFDDAVRIPEPQHPWLDALYREGPLQSEATGLVLPPYFTRLAERFPGDILDLGCNTGENARAVAGLTRRKVWGVDPDEQAIATARRRHGACSNLEFRVGSAYALAGTLPAIASIVCNHALHHLDDLDATLDQMDAALTGRKGLLYLYDFDRAAVAHHFADLGLPLSQLARYRALAMAGDGAAFVRLMERLGHRRERILLTYVSWLAAYTGREVAQKLLDRGYQVLWGVDLPRGVFAVQAVKNGSFLDRAWLAWMNQRQRLDASPPAHP